MIIIHRLSIIRVNLSDKRVKEKTVLSLGYYELLYKYSFENLIRNDYTIKSFLLFDKFLYIYRDRLSKIEKMSDFSKYIPRIKGKFGISVISNFDDRID